MDDSEVQEKMTDIANIQDSISDLTIGATIDESIYPQLEALVNDAGMTAEEASAFLSNIGIDIDPSGFNDAMTQADAAAAAAGQSIADGLTVETDLESGTAQDTTTDTYYDVLANVTPVGFSSILPAGEEGGSPRILSGSVSQVTYTTQPKTISKSTEQTGYAINARPKGKGGGGGGLTIKPGAAKKGAAGGSKFSASPYGGGSRGGRGGGGGGSCFIAGTLIALQNNCKPIESVKIGDIVLSYNEKTRENEYSIVRQTMVHSVEEELYTLYIENEQLTATGIHRFLILRDEKLEWIPASDLQINDLVLFSDYSWHKISQIDIKIQKTTVYNFEVSNTHNYYVGHNQILAHNKGGGGGGGGGKSNGPKSVSKSTELSKSKSAEVENDIYKKVDSTLEKLQDNYSKLNEIKDRTWGKEYRDNAQKSLNLLVKQQKVLDDRIDIAKKYAEALKTGKSNLDYGIDMTDKKSLASLGLKDSDADGVIDNYISKFEEARQKARQLDTEAEAYREAANAEALAY